MTRTLDRISLIGMTLGVALMLQPYWVEGFRVGFFVTLASTALQTIAGRMT